MSEEPAQENQLRIKIRIELPELSSKQRGAVLGLIKDMGFAREEVEELAVVITGSDEAESRRGKKRK